MRVPESIADHYINVPRSIRYNGRVTNIEWLSRAYPKEPDKLRERFVFFVVQEILQTLPFNRISEYRVAISDGLNTFLKQYARVIFNPYKGHLYGSIADLPDDIEICGRSWGIRWLKKRDMSSKATISGLIKKVVSICLALNSSAHFSYIECDGLAEAFASKFYQFVELNAEDLFGKKPTGDTEAILKPMEKSIADAQSELYVLTEDFKELRKGVGELIRRIRMVEAEKENLLDQNFALRQKAEVLSSENKLLRKHIEDESGKESYERVSYIPYERKSYFNRIRASYGLPELDLENLKLFPDTI